MPCGELSRYSDFTFCIAALQMPEGSMFAMHKSLSVARNLNSMIREMKPEHEWFWQIGDDHVFEPDILARLLDREVDVVVPMCVRRQPPFQPLAFKGENEQGHVCFDYDEIPQTGLLDVYACGSAGMLTRRDVLEEIGDPWFESTAGDVVNEDLNFCRKLREAGIRIHVDTEACLGHIGHFKVFPKLQASGPRGELQWGIGFDFGKGPDGSLNALFIRPGAKEA